MIRPAVPEDAPEIAAVWNHYIRHTAATFTTEEKTPQVVVAELERRNLLGFPFLVAIEGGVLTGFASYAEFRKGSGYSYTMEHSVMLRPEYCGSGQGRALLEKLEGCAEENSVRHLVAGVSGENEMAIRFHERLGYRKVGHLAGAGYKFGRWMDLILLQKSMDLMP